MCKSGCACGICAEMKLLDENLNGVGVNDTVPFLSIDPLTGVRTCAMGKIPEETLTFIDNEGFDAATNTLSFDYTDEDGATSTHEFVIPAPVSVVNSIDLKPTGNANEFTIEIVYTNDAGVQTTITDTTPITIPSLCEEITALTTAAAVPANALAVYQTAAGVCGKAPFPAGPSYLTCDGSALTTTDRIATAPTGAFTSGFTVNQDAAGECLSRSDIYYNLARRSYTQGYNYMSNDAQGYGSSVTGGLRNTTATAASYSHIGGGYDHSITTGTSNFIGGGRNNDITAGSYNGITHGYNQNITAGNYNTIGGGVSNDIKAGSYNTIVGGSAIDFEAGTGSYNVAGGVNHTMNGGAYDTLFGNNNTNDSGNANFLVGQGNRVRVGSYVGQIGYSHDNVAGSATTQSGYNHTNTSGSYNTQTGYAHRIDVGQSTTQGGQSNRNRSGNFNAQLGFSHDIVSGSGSFQGGYNQTNTGSYNTQLGVNHRNLTGNSNTQLGQASIQRTGSYNAQIGYSHDSTGTGNIQLVYNLTTNTNYSVSIGRNLVNTTPDGIMIANSFQRLGFYNATPIARQTLPAVATAAQITTALRNLGLIG